MVDTSSCGGGGEKHMGVGLIPGESLLPDSYQGFGLVGLIVVVLIIIGGAVYMLRRH